MNHGRVTNGRRVTGSGVGVKSVRARHICLFA